MFTNWLTNSVPTTATTTSGGSNSALEEKAATSSSSATSNAAALAAAANSTSSLMSTPPDVVLEVGPAPSVRFVAHSIVLGMHSGYLRSAIRLDEQIGVHAAATGPAGVSTDLVLYLGNVTAEQFAPLLTYMYTGYLDLNVDNIFAVLLATHVLHMPRALEICRSFLARAQSDGYLGSTLPPAPTVPAGSGRIIRPIPSKATVSNYGFIATPMLHHLALPTSHAAQPTFKTLPQQQHAGYQTQLLAKVDDSTATKTSAAATALEDDNDEEVFIDSNDNSVASPELDCNISVTSSKDVDVEKEVVEVVDVPLLPQPATSSCHNHSDMATKPSTNARSLAKREKMRQNRSNNKSRRQKSPAGCSGLQVAKAPILASELDVERTVTAVPASESSKVIIDVASCDGPVRFRRILNTAYGHKPESGVYSNALPPERTQQSVSLSFHQQMAKTISQQRQLQHAEESENSESSGSNGAGGVGCSQSGSGGGSNAKSGKTNSNEIYVCVYCKHSFKSQYCYQKHAKRHLNPLSLNCSNALEPACSNASSKDNAPCESLSGLRQSSAATAAASSTSTLATRLPQSTSAEQLRREVRPLDMNVQYYPCKTCGSKFPSYYFVHKHRKLCHAEEEAQESESRRAAGGSSSVAGAAKKLE